MIRWLIGAGFLLVFVALFLLMRAGWTSRKRRQAGLGLPTRAPEFLRTDEAAAAALALVDLLYVATTTAGDPLDRVAVAGLGFRGRAVVSVHAEGVVLDIAGEEPVLIGRDSLRDVGRSTWTIDRVVEADGLIRIGWRLGDADLDTYLRADEPAALIDAIDSLIRTPVQGTASTDTQEKTS